MPSQETVARAGVVATLTIGALLWASLANGQGLPLDDGGPGGGQGGAGIDGFATEAAQEDLTNDPFEPVNRGIFAFNEAMDVVIVRPVAIGYRTAVPQPLRNNFQSFLRNLRAPVTLANNLLQGDWEAAENTAARFFINSTLGLGGWADVAAEVGKEYEPADFGQTMGRWGVGSGPYIVLPVLGPSNVRDGVGTAVDIIADPAAVVAVNEGIQAYNYGRTGIELVDTRSRYIEEVDDLRRASFDYYVTMRSLYQQQRAAMIRGEDIDTGVPSGMPTFEDFEGFDDFEDFEGFDDPGSGDDVNDAEKPNSDVAMLRDLPPASGTSIDRQVADGSASVLDRPLELDFEPLRQD